MTEYDTTIFLEKPRRGTSQRRELCDQIDIALMIGEARITPGRYRVRIERVKAECPGCGHVTAPHAAGCSHELQFTLPPSGTWETP